MMPCTPNQLPGSRCKPPPRRKSRRVPSPTRPEFECDSFFSILRSLHDGLAGSNESSNGGTNNSLQLPSGVKPINSSSIAGFHSKALRSNSNIKQEQNYSGITESSGSLVVHSKEIKPKHSRGDIERTNFPASHSHLSDSQAPQGEDLTQPSIRTIVLDDARPMSSRISVQHLTWLILYVASDAWETRIRSNWKRAKIAFEATFKVPVPGPSLQEKWRYIGHWVTKQKLLQKRNPGEDNMIDGDIENAMKSIHEREALRQYQKKTISMEEMQMAITGQVGWLGPYRDETIRLIRERGGEIWDLAEKKVNETSHDQDLHDDGSTGEVDAATNARKIEATPDIKIGLGDK